MRAQLNVQTAMVQTRGDDNAKLQSQLEQCTASMHSSEVKCEELATQQLQMQGRDPGMQLDKLQDLSTQLRGAWDRVDALILQKREAAEDQKLCVICQVNVKAVVLLPCAHLCLCADCEKQGVTRCPMCRQDVASFLRVYA